MFIHWGLYSIPAGVWQGKEITGYNEQIQGHARIPKAEYEKLAERFDPQQWDSSAVVELAKQAGMKFIVLTAKHHDGFSLFHTAQSPFNVVDATPYGRDIVADLAQACAEGGLSFGVYFSTIDWHFGGATPIDYHASGSIKNDNLIPAAHADFNAAQLRELLAHYGSISEVWFDMGCPTPEQSELFTDSVHELQPDTMVSGRVFNYQGDFTVMGDNEIPPYQMEEPWQCPASIYHETWGYRSWQDRSDLAGKTREHIQNLVRVISRGGNYLLNIGPRGDGSIVEFEAEVLKGIGNWLSINRIAIDGTSPQPFRHLDFGAATTVGHKLYLFVFSWPDDGVLRMPGLQTEMLSARILGGDEVLLLPDTTGAGVRSLFVGDTAPDFVVPVIEVELEERAIVWHPCPLPNDQGIIELLPADADKFFHVNGRGYYDPPRLYKQRWWVHSVIDSTYRVSATFEPSETAVEAQIQFGGDSKRATIPAGPAVTIELGDLTITENSQVEIFVTPPQPFEKGVRLEPTLRQISLTPIEPA